MLLSLFAKNISEEKKLKKNILEEFEKEYHVIRINSHHGHRAIILSKKNLGTKSKNLKKTMMSDGQFGGKLRRRV